MGNLVSLGTRCRWLCLDLSLLSFLVLMTICNLPTETEGYVPWGRPSALSTRIQPWRSPVPTTSAHFATDEDESDKPQPPNTPPPVSFFALSKEEAEEERKRKAEAEKEAAAEAARIQAEEEARLEEQAKQKEEEERRQAEIAAQRLLEAERKAQEEEQARMLREEENRRRQEEFEKWTNEFMDKVINPVTDIQKGVSSDRIKGAALTGAALGLLAGNGVGVAGAAGLTAAYLSISKGVAGDVLRTVGGITWDATDTSLRLLKILALPTNKLTASLSERAKDVLSKVQSQQDSITSASVDDITDADQVAQEYLDLTKVLEEAEAVLDEADAAIAKAQEEEKQAEDLYIGGVDLSIPYDAAAVLAYQESNDDVTGMDYNTIIQMPSFILFKKGWKEQSIADVAAKNAAKNLAAEEKRLAEEEARRAKEMEEARMEAERIAEEERLAAEEEEEDSAENEEDDYYMDDDEDEWAATIEMAQDGMDGKIIGIEEMIADNNAKAEWDAAGALARELSSDEDEDDDDDDLLDDDDDFDDEIDFEDLDMEALGKAARDAVLSFESEVKQGEKLREEQKKEWADSMITDDDVDEDNEDMSVGGELDGAILEVQNRMKNYDGMTKSELQDMLRARGLKISGSKADVMDRLREDDLKTIASLGGTDVEAEMDDEVDEIEIADSDLDVDMDEIDLEELGRQARAAVEMFETRDLATDIDEPTEEMLAEIEDEISTLDLAADTVDYSELTVAELKEECRSKGLKVSGRKAELIERLESAS